MGIKSLSKFLRDKFPGVFRKIHISEYAEKKVAIDIVCYVWKYKCVLGEHGWSTGFTRFLLKLRKFNIHPVIILENKARPEKNKEQAKRREIRAKTKQRTDTLEFDLVTARETGEISEELEAFHNKLDVPQKRSIADNGTVVNIDFSSVQEKLDKRRKGETGITREDLELIEEIAKALGIPCIMPDHESETYCAELVTHGYVSAILSEDTDALAYACPVSLCKFDVKEMTCNEIVYDHLLQTLNLTHAQFLDFCILCGNDYNSNIPGIGPVKAYSLLCDYGSLEEMESTGKWDMTNFDYKLSRKLFRVSSNGEFPVIGFCEFPDIENVGKVFETKAIGIRAGEVQSACFETIYMPGEIPVEEQEIIYDENRPMKSFRNERWKK